MTLEKLDLVELDAQEMKEVEGRWIGFIVLVLAAAFK